MAVVLKHVDLLAEGEGEDAGKNISQLVGASSGMLSGPADSRRGSVEILFYPALSYERLFCASDMMSHM